MTPTGKAEIIAAVPQLRTVVTQGTCSMAPEGATGYQLVADGWCGPLMAVAAMAVAAAAAVDLDGGVERRHGRPGR